MTPEKRNPQTQPNKFSIIPVIISIMEDEEKGVISLSKLSRLVAERTGIPDNQSRIEFLLRSPTLSLQVKHCINPMGNPPEGYADNGYYLIKKTQELINKGILGEIINLRELAIDEGFIDPSERW